MTLSASATSNFAKTLNTGPMWRDDALRITNIMYESPGCALFRDPVDPESDGIPDYVRIVRNPQDLGTIRARLLASEYSAMSAWESDTRLVWSNCEKYNGKASLVGKLAAAMTRKFDRLVKDVCPTTSVKWVERMAHLYVKLDKTMQIAPPVARTYLGDKEFSGPVPHDEMQKLCEAASALTSRDDVVQMLQLVSLFGVSVDTTREEGFVPVKSLPPDGQRALIGFVRGRYNELKMQYP